MTTRLSNVGPVHQRQRGPRPDLPLDYRVGKSSLIVVGTVVDADAGGGDGSVSRSGRRLEVEEILLGAPELLGDLGSVALPELPTDVQLVVMVGHDASGVCRLTAHPTAYGRDEVEREVVRLRSRSQRDDRL